MPSYISQQLTDLCRLFHLRRFFTTRLLNLSLWSLKCYQKFFCGGRLIFGPDVASLFLTVLLIAVPALIFCVKVYVNKIRHHADHWYPILLIGASLTVLVSNIQTGYLYFYVSRLSTASWTNICTLKHNHNRSLHATLLQLHIY